MRNGNGKFDNNNLIHQRISTRRRSIILLVLILGNSLLISCGKRDEKTELLVGAAASLEPAMKEVQILYEEQHPEVDLNFTFASSGTIEQQIREGAPIGLFVSAAEKQMDALSEDNLIITTSRMDLFKNEVVLIVPEDSKLEINNFNDITKANIIAIGDPESVPAGQYAKKIFEELGIWDAVYEKATLGKDVTEVSAWVSSGDADAGIVYRSDALISNSIKIAAGAPEGSSIAIYPAAVIAGTKVKNQAEEFLAFLDTKDSSDIFMKYGFGIID